MFPLWDDIPSSRIPFVNYLIIAICILAFIVQAQSERANERIVREYGMIPLRVTHPSEKEVVFEVEDRLGRHRREVIELTSPIPPIFTLITCMFLHGGLMHIVGNLWFLYIFGDNIEDRFGHLRYAMMYLICGIAAGLMHIAIDQNSVVPTIGASGAIAGVMGAYLLLYPHAQVMTLIPLGVLSRLTPIPAVVFLGLWFVFQLVSGFQVDPSAGGVAWWAHVGGFLAGLALTYALKQTNLLNPPPPPAAAATSRVYYE